MNIVGKKVILRAVEEQDLPLLHQWANDPEIWKLLGGWRFASNLESTRTWFKGLVQDSKNLRYAITTREEGELIGTANIINIDMKNANAFHGMMLGPVATRGHGYGRDTVMAVMRYAFDELRLERLDGDIIDYNQASYKLYVGKCGWVEEGRQRRWHYRQGQYWDKIIVGVTRGDYEALLAQTDYWNQP